MADLKITIFKNGEAFPDTTITVPGGALKAAACIIPGPVAATLNERGIDINALVQLMDKCDVQGPLMEIENHQKKERVIIAVK